MGLKDAKVQATVGHKGVGAANRAKTGDKPGKGAHGKQLGMGAGLKRRKK